MAYLREAVEKQKVQLIEQLINNGIVQSDEHGLFNKTLSEILNEYDQQLLITQEKCDKNTLKFTRSIQLINQGQFH